MEEDSPDVAQDATSDDATVETKTEGADETATE